MGFGLLDSSRDLCRTGKKFCSPLNAAVSFVGYIANMKTQNTSICHSNSNLHIHVKIYVFIMYIQFKHVERNNITRMPLSEGKSHVYIDIYIHVYTYL